MGIHWLIVMVDRLSTLDLGVELHNRDVYLRIATSIGLLDERVAVERQRTPISCPLIEFDAAVNLLAGNHGWCVSQFARIGVAYNYCSHYHDSEAERGN